MDLVLLIVLIIAAIILFYLIETIRSLQREVREMKIKCINLKNNDAEYFTENTNDPVINISENMINLLNNAKNYFDKNT